MAKLGLMEKAGVILQERGADAVELARSIIFSEHVGYQPLQNALHYFIKDWNDFLHPGLAALACEAVGGLPKETSKIGAALVLLAGGADVHDDLIDESLVKGSAKTVLGKFGRDLTILTGDALLLEGAYLLHEACEYFDTAKKKAILNVVKRSFFEISGAEAKEANLRGRIDIQKQEYVDIIEHKVAAGEASMRIGGIIGGGDKEEVEILGEYGRIYGIFLSIRDEFVDIFEADELGNRVEKEVLPLPILAALTNELLKPKLLSLLKGPIDKNIEDIVNLVMDSSEGKVIVQDMNQMAKQIKLKLQKLSCSRKNLLLLIDAALEGL